MISVVLLIFGGCHQNVVVQQQKAVVQQVVAQQVAYVPAVYVQPLVQTYGVVDPYWTPRDTSAQRIEQLIEAVEKQQALIQQLTAQPQKAPCDDCEKSEIANDAQAIISRSCVSCHSGDTAKGKLDLTNPDNYQSKLQDIIEKVDSGEMPPPPKDALSNDDADIVRVWASKQIKAALSQLK